MKNLNRIKKVALAGIVTLTLVVGVFVNQSTANEAIPVSGCKYSGVESDFCVAILNGGLWGVTSCTNTTSATTCGIAELPPPPQN